jgi:hypothetical protein
MVGLPLLEEVPRNSGNNLDLLFEDARQGFRISGEQQVGAGGQLYFVGLGFLPPGWDVLLFALGVGGLVVLEEVPIASGDGFGGGIVDAEAFGSLG